MSAISIATDVLRAAMLPPLSLFFLYAIGLALGMRQPRAARMVRATALALLFALCTNAGAWLLIAPLEHLEKPLSMTRGGNAQAIVVLAAGRLENSPEYGGKDVPDYITLARLRYAAKLHHETGLPVLVSGGLGSSGRIEPLANGMASALRDEFATPVKWLEDGSGNTAQNAAFSASILNPAGIHRIFLVTDAMHMHRAKIAFEKNGLDAVAAPTVFFSAVRITPRSFLPSAEGLRRSQYAIYEWLGLVWYSIRY